MVFLLASLPWQAARAQQPPIFSNGGIAAPGTTPAYSITGTGYGSFAGIVGSGIASGGTLDTAGVNVSGGTPSSAPTSNTLNLSCLPNGFPGGASNIRNHAQVCIQGVASEYNNNGIYGDATNGAYNDNDYMVQLGLDVKPGSNNGVGLYNIVQGEAGASQFWAMNTVTQIQSGVTSNAFGYELDMNNVSGQSSNSNVGLWVTGASANTNYAAVNVSGASSTQWHLGYLVTQDVDTAAFINKANSSDMLVDQGTHAGYGLKMTGTYGISAIRLTSSSPSGAISWESGSGGYPTSVLLAPSTDGGLHLTGAPLAADGGLTAASATVSGAATVGSLSTTGGITAANYVLSSGGNVVFQNSSAQNVGTLGYVQADDKVETNKSFSTAGGITAASATISGSLTATGSIVANGNINMTSHYVTFTANSSCYMFHDDSAAGLVWVCGGQRLMRIPDNGTAPIFKVVPVAGTP